MATGKQWRATLVQKIQQLSPDFGFYYVLYYDTNTTPDAIRAMWPALPEWDFAYPSSTGGEMTSLFLSNASSYDSYEEAMLDLLHAGDPIYGGTAGGSVQFRYYLNHWCGASGVDPLNPFGQDYAEDPASFWGHFTDQPTFAATEDAPWADVGVGLVQYQALWSADSLGEGNGEIPTPGSGVNTFGMPAGYTDIRYIFMPLVTDDVIDPDFPAEDEDQRLTLRCWEFSLDGHDFYVLRLGPSETLVYDLTTGQWSSWKSPELDYLRAHVGQNWVGMTDTLRSFETDVVAGDDTEGILWILDPTSGLDDNITAGSAAFRCVVNGGVPFNGRDAKACSGVEVVVALGDPTIADAYIQLRTSDDLGNTWIDHGIQTLTTDSFDQVVEWYSLGLMQQPGRIFEFSDSGATVRIGRADLR